MVPVSSGSDVVKIRVCGIESNMPNVWTDIGQPKQVTAADDDRHAIASL